jgi:peptide deformylase
MRLKIVQVGDPVLRQAARSLSPDEIRSVQIQQLIELMRETMRDAPGVGLAAPQVGEAIRLVVIEDRAEYTAQVPAEQLAERERVPVPFQVLANPTLTVVGDETRLFFEGCLSLSGFVALTPRARSIRVEALDERAEPVRIEATGWFARILQHETDHLNGKLYVDRMLSRSFMSEANYSRQWRTEPIDRICAALGIGAQDDPANAAR